MKKIIFKIKMFLYKLFHKKDYLLSKQIVCYICGNEEFLPTISTEEENELLAQKEAGSQEALTKLIEHNLRLVAFIAKKFESTGINVEDLISIGTIGLIKAVNTFCPSKNIKLATYASRCIENEILMYLRKNQSQRNEVSIDEPLNIDWDGMSCCFPISWGPSRTASTGRSKTKPNGISCFLPSTTWISGNE